MASSPTQSGSAQAPARSNRYRLLAYKIALFSLIMVGGGELVCRAFWMIERKAPLLAPKILWYAYYPQMRNTGVENAAQSKTEDSFDILILGGSTISEDYGPIGLQLRDGMSKRLRKPVRLFNLAFPAHNSRDSMLKHRWLREQRFDLVVVYDGINDTRMNNTPPDKFRDDYSHCLWYQSVNRLDQQPTLYHSALPFTLLQLRDRAAEEAGLTWYASRLNPQPEVTKYGKEVRTHVTLRKNLGEIVTTAKERGERVVAMTFSYHIPENYTLELCTAGKLDYATTTVTPVEIWGEPAHVIAALNKQNAAVRELAAEHPEVVFIDQAQLMTRCAKNFLDCCHFTELGCTEFTQNILAALDARK